MSSQEGHLRSLKEPAWKNLLGPESEVVMESFLFFDNPRTTRTRMMVLFGWPLKTLSCTTAVCNLALERSWLRQKHGSPGFAVVRWTWGLNEWLEGLRRGTLDILFGAFWKCASFPIPWWWKHPPKTCSGTFAVSSTRNGKRPPWVLSGGVKQQVGWFFGRLPGGLDPVYLMLLPKWSHMNDRTG